MKRKIVCVALICGVLGSSYAQDYNSYGSNSGRYNLSSSSQTGDLSQFRTSGGYSSDSYYSQGNSQYAGQQNQYASQQNQYGNQQQYRTQSSTGRFSAPETTGTQAPGTTGDNYVINDQTGERVSLENAPSFQQQARGNYNTGSREESYSNSSYGAGYPQENTQASASRGYEQTNFQAPAGDNYYASSGGSNNYQAKRAAQTSYQNAAQTGYQDSSNNRSYQYSDDMSGNYQAGTGSRWQQDEASTYASSNAQRQSQWSQQSSSRYQQQAQTSYQQQPQNSYQAQSSPQWQAQNTGAYAEPQEQPEQGGYVQRGRSMANAQSMTESDQQLNAKNFSNQYKTHYRPAARESIEQKKTSTDSHRRGGGFKLGNPFRGVTNMVKNLFQW
jgi:hypothetical protein